VLLLLLLLLLLASTLALVRVSSIFTGDDDKLQALMLWHRRKIRNSFPGPVFGLLLQPLQLLLSSVIIAVVSFIPNIVAAADATAFTE
jgi:hypothetical protein